MPTYEYQCKNCGQAFEIFQSMKDDPLRVAYCPSCKKRCRVERLIGAGAGFIFKGSGFYATDYRSKEYKEKAKKDSPPTDSASKDSTSKESSSKAKSTKSSKE